MRDPDTKSTDEYCPLCNLSLELHSNQDLLRCALAALGDDKKSGQVVSGFQ